LQGSYAKKNWQLYPPSQPDFTGFMRRKKRQAIENLTQNFKKTKQVRQSYDFSLLNIVPQYKRLRTFLS
jgi:hypothetical protein